MELRKKERKKERTIKWTTRKKERKKERNTLDLKENNVKERDKEDYINKERQLKIMKEWS